MITKMVTKDRGIKGPKFSKYAYQILSVIFKLFFKVALFFVIFTWISFSLRKRIPSWYRPLAFIVGEKSCI